MTSMARSTADQYADMIDDGKAFQVVYLVKAMPGDAVYLLDLPTMYEIVLALLLTATDDNDHLDAADTWREVIKLHPDNTPSTEAEMLRAQALRLIRYSFGPSDKSLQIAAALIERTTRLTNDYPTTALRKIAEARLQHALGKWSGAIDIAENADFMWALMGDDADMAAMQDLRFHLMAFIAFCDGHLPLQRRSLSRKVAAHIIKDPADTDQDRARIARTFLVSVGLGRRAYNRHVYPNRTR